jgi:hypothetical protein
LASPVVKISSLVLAVAVVAACGGDSPSGNDAAGTQTAAATSDAHDAQRPSWFPPSFPLPANTVIVSQQPAQAGGGTVVFAEPVAFLRAVQILELNFASHGYTVKDQSRDSASASYTIESDEFTATVQVKPDGENATVEATLTPK